MRELKQVIDAAIVFARSTIDVGAVTLALEHRPRVCVTPEGRTRDADLSAEPRDGMPRGDAEEMTIERDRMLVRLRLASWDTERIAGELGLHRSTLYRRLRRLGITLPASWARTASDR